jgi:hypothetical protein
MSSKYLKNDAVKNFSAQFVALIDFENVTDLVANFVDFELLLLKSFLITFR